MSEENMKVWDKVSRPPLTALKQIKGGRLSGMSNISPQWRYQIMTQTFGVIGFGWKYSVEKRWTSPGANEEQFAFAEILLYVKMGEVWSEPIPGEGGSMLISKESKGLHNNDEAFKMAVTDALGTAMAKLGVGADIYLGTFDGSKYNDAPSFPKQVNTKEEAEAITSPAPLTGNVDVDFPPIKFTVKNIRNSADHVSNISKDSGKTVPEVLAFIKTLDTTQEYSINKIVKLIKGEE